MSAEPPVIIAMDVADLDRSCAFYARALGMSVVTVERAGLIFESRVVAGGSLPGIGFHLRKQFGIRVSACHPGTVLRLSFKVASLAKILPALRAAEPKWLGPAPADSARHVHFVDPDGYELELFEERTTLVVPPPPG